jgi:hypothetical protein
MLTVTTAALDRLSTKLARKKAGEGMALRFTRRPGGWRLRLDRADPADKTYTHEGRNVLLLDQDVSRAMASMTLDVRVTNRGPRLRLRATMRGKD